MMVSGRNRASKTKAGRGAFDDSLDVNSSHPLRTSEHDVDEGEKVDEEEEDEED
jgi:hypothetical protein